MTCADRNTLPPKIFSQKDAKDRRNRLRAKRYRSVALKALLPMCVAVVFCVSTEQRSCAALTKNERQCEQLYGPPLREAGNGGLAGGGKHVFYQCNVRGKSINVECLFVKKKCVGVSYATDSVGSMNDTIANALLAENGGLQNWQVVSAPVPGMRNIVHVRLKHVASWSLATLTLWTSRGQSLAAKEDPDGPIVDLNQAMAEPNLAESQPGMALEPLPNPCGRELIKQSVKEGMSTDQVIALLGPPESTSDSGSSNLVFHYQNRSVDPFTKKTDFNIMVVFENGKFKKIDF